MKKVRMALLLLLLLMSTINYYQVSNLFDLDNQELDEEKQLNNRKIPILASNSTVIVERIRNHNQATELQWLGEQNLENTNNNKTMYSGIRLPSFKLTTRGPIDIDNDTAFGPSGYNFTGSGTESYPYVIEGYNITDSTTNLIDIQDTTVYFVIRDSILNGITGTNNGIFLFNVKNGIIENNTIKNVEIGILLAYLADNITISSNIICNNSLIGIVVGSSANNTLSENAIYNNTMAGIVTNSSDFNTIKGNIIYNNTDGIWLDASANHSILDNQVFNNSQFGCFLRFGGNHTVSGNNIYNNSFLGVHINLSSNNQIDRNNFIDNYNIGTSKSQAQDNGSNNVFIYNYWEDWISPDSDDNGYVDNPYLINGTPGNLDSYPLRYSFKGYIPHQPISITNNNDFSATYNFPGSGTINNPYLIEGYNFTDGTTNLVTIWNTDAFFIIQNCLLNGVTGSNTGLTLSNVMNGFVEHNIIINCDYGLYVQTSSNNEILDNSFSNNEIVAMYMISDSDNNTLSGNIINSNIGHGFYLYSNSNNNTIFNNTFSANGDESIHAGIYIRSYNNSVINNYIINNNHHGIYLSHADNNSIRNNSVYGNGENGFLILESENNTIHENIIHDNSNGFALEGTYLNRIYNNTIYSNSNGITIFRSNNDMIYNNNISSNGYGIQLQYSYTKIISHNITIESNSFISNSIAIRMVNVSDCDVLDNEFILSLVYGIYLTANSSDNTLSRNVIRNSSDYGVYLDSTTHKNIISLNEFYFNKLGNTQAYDSGLDNIFQYNYWDDHTGPDTTPADGYIDNPYTIFGGSNTDPYPRAYPLLPHSPIYIDEDADFATLGFSGQGTINDPYVIEEYFFINSTTTLIHIQDTTAYFIIRYNNLNSIDMSDIGIFLQNVTNGYIHNNSIQNGAYGINLVMSDNNNLTYNNVFNCGNPLDSGGIDIQQGSDYNILKGNEVYNCTKPDTYAISLHISDHNLIENNQIYNDYSGLRLYSSDFNNVSYNIIDEIFGTTNSIGIWSEVSNNNTFSYNIITNNNYEPCYLYDSDYNIIEGNIIANNSRSGIDLHSNSVGNNIRNNTIYNHTQQAAVRLRDYSANNLITNNTFYQNKWGILCGWGSGQGGCNNNDIINNTMIDQTDYGIQIEKASYNMIVNNTISNNTLGGIYLINSAGYNTIYSNNIFNNVGGQADDDNGTNEFYYPNWGNYWGNAYTGSDLNGDGIGDSPYSFPGNLDLYPLVHPIEWYYSFNISVVTGNWDVTATEIHQDKIFVLNGNVTIQSGGNLTLNNVIIRFNCSFDGQYHIEVNSGGNLTITTNSIVTNVNTSNVWYLKANGGSNIYFKNSTFNYAGLPGPFVSSGIWINTDYSEIVSCIFHNCHLGLILESADFSEISDNIIRDINQDGIRLYNSNNNSISGNIITNTISSYAIFLDQSDYNEIFDNIVNECFASGIFLNMGCNYNNFTQNLILKSKGAQGHGISLLFNCDFNLFFNNSVIGNNRYGIYLNGAHNNTLLENRIADNLDYGIYTNNCENNSVRRNKFNNNMLGGIQARDTGSNNTFIYNYWDDHTGSDSNYDGIIDTPYIFTGNSDSYPLARPYTLREPIFINDDTDFAALGFSGNGSLSNPYIIENCYIMDPSVTLIRIQDTTAYFIIRNNLLVSLTGINDSIYLFNVRNGTILDNIIHSAKYGIYLESSINNTLSGNSIYNNSYHSIYLLLSTENNVSYNNVLNNSRNGITVSYSNSNVLSFNTVANNSQYGIVLFDAHDNSVFNNTIYNNTLDGIILTNSTTRTTLVNNTVYNNSRYGIMLAYSSTDNNISFNDIYGNLGTGIVLYLYCSSNILSYNTIYSNFKSGIGAVNSSSNNILSNNYIFNNSWDGIGLTNSSNNNNITNNEIHYNLWNGIFMNASSSHNTLSDNTLFNNSENGILLESSAFNNTVVSNSIYNNSLDGIAIDGAHNNTLLSNVIQDQKYGILLRYSLNTTCSYNSIYNSSYDSISLQFANYTTIIGNNVSNNAIDGIVIGFSYHNIIINNTLSNNNYVGIYILSSSFNLVMTNLISNHLNDTFMGIGIMVAYQTSSSINNTISNNTISDNINFGIILVPNSANNTIKWNDFLNNNPNNTLGLGSSQAYDNGTTNLFINNFWSDWTGPDTNPADGIVDVPYVINGSAGNFDPFPLAFTAIHDLSIPTVRYPNDGGVFGGTIILQWDPAIDSWNHSVTYTLFYSSDGGGTWTLIDSDWKNTNYTWDTTFPLVLNGTNYLIQVKATCSTGLWQVDTSDFVFTINNVLVDSTPPEITDFPSNYSYVELTVGHSLTWIATDQLPDTYTIWRNNTPISNYINVDWFNNAPITINIDNLSPGLYIYKIEFLDSSGKSSTHEVWVTVTENAPPIVTITQPEQDDILDGTIAIAWTAIDPEGEPMTYSVDYWNGNLWINLVTSLSTTATTWDTTNVIDRPDYKIRVNASDGYKIGVNESGLFTIDNIESFAQIPAGFTKFEVTDTITVGLDVKNSVNVTINRLSDSDVPDPPSDLESLNIYLNITISDTDALNELWINISFAELDVQNPDNVKIYFFDERLDRWEEVKSTGVDFDREVVWGMMEHLTLFGVMDEQTQPADNWLTLLVMAFILITPVIVVTLFIYRRAKKRMRMKKSKEEIRKSQIDLGILTRDLDKD